MKKLRQLYDCIECPAYCCTYPRIDVDRADMKPIARRFGITLREAMKRFTHRNPGTKEIILRHRKDEVYGSTACMFLDPRSRRCRVYEDRPKTCRKYPHEKRCGYWEFLKFERNLQGDAHWVARTNQ